MKHLLAPLTAVVLAATGYSLHAAGWFHSSDSSRVTTTTRAADRGKQDRFASDAALRHRGGQPHHWRAMLMVK